MEQSGVRPGALGVCEAPSIPCPERIGIGTARIDDRRDAGRFEPVRALVRPGLASHVDVAIETAGFRDDHDPFSFERVGIADDLIARIDAERSAS